MKHFLYIASVLIITASCKGQTADTTETEGNRVHFTKELAEKYNLPELPFSVVVPDSFEYEFEYRPNSAIGIYKIEDDTIRNEIVITISAFDVKYTPEQELIWLKEFENRPDIKSNPDLVVKIHEDYLILNEKRSIFSFTVNNENGKYPTDRPMNSVGITYPTEDRMKGVVVAISKWNINLDNPFSEIELGIVNSIKFE